MPLLGSRGAASLTGFGGLAKLGYLLRNSLRFRASNSAYLSRTGGTPSNGKTATYSFWMKRGNLSSGTEWLFSGGTTTSLIGFNAGGDLISVFGSDTSAEGNITTAVFRDPAAWYHVVIRINTTEGTAADRAKIYVNGVQQAVITNAGGIVLDSNWGFNTAGTLNIGRYTGASGYCDLYLAEVHFIDGGTPPLPTAFAKTDPVTGQWIPIKYTGTYGNNGFYLNFNDNSAATAAAIGKDSSGNGNNWTPSGISVTTGTTYDSMTDVPTLTSATAANYCVINPLSGTGGTVSNGNLEFVGPDSVWHSRNGTLAFPTSGQWYFEATLLNAPFSSRASNSSYNWIGVGLATNFNVQLGPASNQVNGFLWGDNGYINNFSSSSVDSTVALSSGDVMRLGIDTTNNTYTLYRNASLVASSTFNVTAGTQLVPYQISYSGAYGKMAVNFGQRPFVYPTTSGAFSGFKALNTYNLP